MPTKKRPPSRLFLYAFRTEGADPERHSYAAVATISPEGFHVAHEFSRDAFDQYTLVASAANAGERWLFFHNLYTGAIETGRIAPDFRFVKSTPPKRLSPDLVHVLNMPGPYSHAAVDGLGFLLLALGLRPPDAQSVHRSRVTLAQVLSDGTFFPIHTSTLDIPAPADAYGGASLVGLPVGHAWLADSLSSSSTVYVLVNGKIVSSRTWTPGWGGMVAHGDSLLLFGMSPKRLEICGLDAAFNLVTISTTSAGTIPNHWGFVANTPRALLAYDYATGWGQVRALGPGAFTPTTGADLALSWGWSSMAWC